MSAHRLLAIETSCDETAAAVIEEGRNVRSSVVSSQIARHAPYGGVVPDLAARLHLEALVPVVQTALREAECRWDDLDAMAVTRGPGLVGCLLVGTAYVRAAAAARQLPIVGVSHMVGHLYSAWLADPGLEPPFIALVVSGGHTDVVEVRDFGAARSLASTRDDAVGEAFDKVARLIGLGYPGGPAIQKAAEPGNATAFSFPKTNLRDSFSFSGLKTAVRYTVRDLPGLDDNGIPTDVAVVADLAAGFQEAAVGQLVFGLRHWVDKTAATRIAVVGGVAANKRLRERIAEEFAGLQISIPPLSLCTDNAAMIGAAGWHRLRLRGPDEDFSVDPGLSEYA